MPCSHVITISQYVHIDYKQIIDDIYKLNYVFNIYSKSFGQMKLTSYQPKYEGTTIRHDPKIWMKKRGHPRSTRIVLKWTKENEDNRSIVHCAKLLVIPRTNIQIIREAQVKIANIPIKLLKFLITNVVVACAYRLSQMLIFNSVSVCLYSKYYLLVVIN